MSYWILVGAFTPLVTLLQFTSNPASLSLVSQTQVGEQPSWLVAAPTSNGNVTTVYSTDEVIQGKIRSLSFDTGSGSLSVEQSIDSRGSQPTHLGLLHGGKMIGAANYGGSGVIFLNVDTVGSTTFSGADSTQFQGKGPEPNQDASHPHQIVERDDEILVPDLGSDKIWRMAMGKDGHSVLGPIDFNPGTGPRHTVVTEDNTLYTISENTNLVTQHQITHDSLSQPDVVARVSIIPPDTNATGLAGAELLYSSTDSLLYASNRKDTHKDGDAITILTTTPKLSAIGYVRTGLSQIRALSFLGPKNEYILAAGLVGGGIKVYERVSAQDGYLKEIAALKSDEIVQPTVFLPFAKATANSVGGTITKESMPTATSTISGREASTSALASGARRRFRIGFF